MRNRIRALGNVNVAAIEEYQEVSSRYEFMSEQIADVDESRRELYHKNAEGKNVSYEPKRYEYSYTFNMTIAVNNPYFSEIPIRVNDSEIKFRASSEYHRAEALAEEIRDLLLGIRADTRKAVEAAAEPKKTVVCPYCGATTTPDEKGCCEYCGAPVSQ